MVVGYEEDAVVGKLAGEVGEFFVLLGGDFVASLLDIDLFLSAGTCYVLFLVHICAKNRVLAHSGSFEPGAIERGRRRRHEVHGGPGSFAFGAAG